MLFFILNFSQLSCLKILHFQEYYFLQKIFIYLNIYLFKSKNEKFKNYFVILVICVLFFLN